jgi:hypothetical protein
VPTYALNEDAVRHAKRLIDARQYVLRSRWQDVQPGAREQNEFLKTHSWEEYAAWHLGLTEGAPEATKARYAFCLRRFPPSAPDGADRLPLPCGGVATQGDRARSTRAPAAPRPKDRLTTRRGPQLTDGHVELGERRPGVDEIGIGEPLGEARVDTAQLLDCVLLPKADERRRGAKLGHV